MADSTIVEPITEPVVEPVVNDDVGSFVNRLYENVLGRDADSAGLNHWITVLESTTASDVAKSFYNSPEFLNGNHSDFEFIQTTYLTFMGREYDDSGMNHWLTQLNSGLSRDGLLDSFSSSSEFAVLAASYGIDAYSTTPPTSVIIATPVEEFVSRFYTEVLGRTPDNDGLNNWVSQLESNASTADDIANGFFFSDEFTNRDTSNNEFVNIAYNTLLGRSADTAGLDNWVSHLANGMSRTDMLDGFIYSQEFSALANEYGINVGEPELPDEPLPEAAPWDELVGEYSLYDMDLTTPDGSSLHISPSDISSIQGEVTASLSIDEDGGFDFYFDAENFDAEGYMDATIQSVSDSEIFYYDHDLNEYDDIYYTLTDPVLTIYDQQDGYNFSIGWVLL